jgi:diguanylate cyclase (GGDEF)-like protein
MNAHIQAHNVLSLGFAALGQLMPMFLLLNAEGEIVEAGPTLRKLCGDQRLTGVAFQDVFAFKRPQGLLNMADLARDAGARLRLSLRKPPCTGFKGLAVPLAGQGGWLLNLSFGIGVTDAVREHDLTDSDFAPTDLTVEMLYLVEAKSAVLTELRKLNQRLQGAKSAAEEQAMTDTLTGLRNRRAMDHTMQNLLHSGTVFSLMHIDLDFFKAVNDTLGHAAGDFVLAQVARVLQEETRGGDTVARVGGDEFVIISPGLSDYPTLSRVAQRIIDRLSAPLEFEGKECQISASIGATLSRLYLAPSPEQMLSDADRALYASKHAGRGRLTTVPSGTAAI